MPLARRPANHFEYAVSVARAGVEEGRNQRTQELSWSRFALRLIARHAQEWCREHAND
jgi:hypothetical protein